MSTMVSSPYDALASNGSLDARDIFSGLKSPKTRRDAFEQLKSLLCNSDISDHSINQEVHNAISYVTSHSHIFHEQQVFTLIDLALASSSSTARQKESFLKLATVMSSTVSSGLNLCPNLKDLASCQGTYLRLMELLSKGRPRKIFSSEIFNAIRSIASQPKFFTNEQYCGVADYAMASRAFTVAQKKHFRMWKKEKGGKRNMDDHLDEEPVVTYASVVSSTSGLCENLRDPISREGAYLQLLEMLCSLRYLESPKSELFDAVTVVATDPRYLTTDQFFRVAACSMYSGVFTEEEKKLIRTSREGRSRAIGEVARMSSSQ